MPKSMAGKNNEDRKRTRPVKESNQGTILSTKRHKTLHKKADELEKLCDAKVCIVSYDPNGNCAVWPEDEEKARAIIMKYKEGGENSGGRNKEVQISDLLGTKIRKFEEKKKGFKVGFNDGVRDQKGLASRCGEISMLSNLPGESLIGLTRSLESTIEKLNERIHEVKYTIQPYCYLNNNCMVAQGPLVHSGFNNTATTNCSVNFAATFGVLEENQIKNTTTANCSVNFASIFEELEENQVQNTTTTNWSDTFASTFESLEENQIQNTVTANCSANFASTNSEVLEENQIQNTTTANFSVKFVSNNEALEEKQMKNKSSPAPCTLIDPTWPSSQGNYHDQDNVIKSDNIEISFGVGSNGFGEVYNGTCGSYSLDENLKTDNYNGDFGTPELDNIFSAMEDIDNDYNILLNSNWIDDENSNSNLLDNCSPPMDAVSTQSSEFNEDCEAADNLAANLMGFESFAENRNVNIDNIMPPTPSCWVDLLGADLTTAIQDQKRSQPIISPLHEALRFSSWPQPLQAISDDHYYMNSCQY